MTKINKEPPIIAVIVMPEAFLSNNRKSLTFYRYTDKIKKKVGMQSFSLTSKKHSGCESYAVKGG